ncbi:MAG TPA: hypothetical protein DIT40_14925 [Alphaproteobacteria bacterium]|nr:hypothetical protein [Alphaproteobacteria bacterium]
MRRSSRTGLNSRNSAAPEPTRQFRKLIIAAGLLPLGGVTAFAQEPLPLRSITLSTSGIALYTHHGKAGTDGKLRFPVAASQIDDFLKSVLIADPEGRPQSLTLPGRAPLSALFANLRFDPDDFQSSASLLRALTGTEITVSGPQKLHGTLLTVTAQAADGALPQQHRVSLLSDGGIRQFILEEAENITFPPEIEAEIATAAAGIAASRAQEQRQVEFTLARPGNQAITLSYLADAPIWKAAYRLVIPGDTNRADKANLQGWAVFENNSPFAWQGVEITLTSGNPVTFRQNLYDSYYVDRPELPVQTYRAVVPRADQGEMDDAAVRTMPAPRAQKMFDSRMTLPMAAAEGSAALPGMPLPQTENREDIGQIHFSFAQKLDALPGHSVSAPIIEQHVPIAASWLYQADTDPHHPLFSLRIENSSERALPPGILTLYSATDCDSPVCAPDFAGDAAFPGLAPGVERFLTFALDRDTRIDRETSSDKRLQKAAISDGILRLSHRLQQTTRYTVRAPETKGRTVIIEHPKRGGWQLAGKAESETPTHYRLALPVAAGKTDSLAVTLERVTLEQISLLDGTNENILVALRATSELDGKLRDALENIAEHRRALARIDAEIATLTRDYQNAVSEQQRVRANLEAVQPDSDLYRDYIGKLTALEADIGQSNKALMEKNAQADKARQALADYIAKLEI